MSGRGPLSTLLMKKKPNLKKMSEYARSNNLDMDELFNVAVKYKALRQELGPDLNPLHVACINDRTKVVLALIKEGYNVNCEAASMDSYLRIALDFGNIAVARLLLEMGADPHSKNRDEKTPIEAALTLNKQKKKCLSALKLLVQEANVSVNEVALHATQQKALHIAVLNNLPSVVSFLLEKGADGNATDLRGSTPLHVACYKNCVEIIKLLITHKVDFYKVNLASDTPLLIVVRENYQEALQALLDGGCDINKPVNGCFSALHCAIEESNSKKVKHLVSLGADPNLKLSNGSRPLHYLALRERSEDVEVEKSKVMEDLDILEYLVENGANINATDEENNTPLLFAVLNKRLKLAKLFIQLGACINLELSMGKILFHHVCCFNNDIITLFLEFGANYDKRNKSGLTPYHTAIIYKVNLKYIKSFIQYGCPYNQDFPVYNKSKARGSEEFLQFCKAQEQLFRGIKENNLVMVRKAVEEGAMPNSTSEECKYPLHFVTSKGYKELVQYLLEKAVPVNKLNNEGETALIIAARRGDLDTCCTLLQYGACYNFSSKKSSKTPEIIAQEKGHKSIVDLLQAVSKMFSYAENGSKSLIKDLRKALGGSYDKYAMYANATNNRGCTVLSTCLNMNHGETAEELMELRNSASLNKI